MFRCILGVALISLQAAEYELIEDQNTLQILSPSLKNRKSVKIRLHNGFEAYLISDPEANQSAAALSVETGSFYDPDAYPGMAHFCEHMLFMGSEKYPDENLFWQVITDNCGKTNAYTKPDRTVYMFSINHENYNHALDVFAHFFIDPLFKEESVKRELNAVNQENLKNLENDGWREYMVMKETANPAHPISKFSTGNADTLSIIPLETLRSWYQKNYVASQMHLVIYSNQSINALITTTVETFSAVSSAPVSKLTYESMLSTTQKGHTLYIEPIKNLKQVTYAWELSNEVASDADGKLGELISYALSSKGEHSLFQILQKEGLAEHLHANIEHFSKNEALLTLSIDLTRAGVTQLDDVSARVFQTIASLKRASIPPHLFQEYKKMADIEYQWQSRSSPFQYVSEMADQMVDEPLATFPLKNTSIYAYKPKALQDVLAKMTPDTVMISVLAPQELTKQKLDRKERWYGVDYTVVKIEEQKLYLWSQILADAKLGSSVPNRFIPGNLTLLSPEKDRLADIPELLSDDHFGKCYFVRDSYYLVPNASLQIGVRSPLITAQPKNMALTDLFVAYLHRRLTPTLSAANRAGLSAFFSQDDLKLVLSVNGFSEKMNLLTQTLFDALKGPTPSRDDFALLKEELLTTYENRSRTLPYVQASGVLSNILYNNAPLSSDLYTSLQQISYEEFCSFQDDLFVAAYLEGVVTGNLETAQANNLWQQVQNHFSLSRYPTSEHTKRKILALPNQQGPYVVKTQTPLQGNGAILMLQSSDTSLISTASQRILASATSEAFFNTLRTKQQIAYIAQSFSREEQNGLLLFFAVHSATHPPEELLARFELFLEDFTQNFETYIPENRFAAMKQSLITSLSKSPDNLTAYTNELALLAYKWNGDFGRKAKLIAAASDLSYDAFKTYSLSLLSRKNTKRVATLVQGSASSPTPLLYQPIDPALLRAHQL